MGGALDAQVMWGAESTYGTAVARTAGLPLLDENVTKVKDVIRDEAIIAGRRLATWEQHVHGNIQVGGNFRTHIYGSGMRALLTAANGTETDPGSGDPRAFTYDPGDMSDDSMTFEFNAPSRTADQLKIVDGAMITGYQIEFRQNQLAVVTWDLVGQDMVTAGSPTALVAPLAFRAMKCVGMTVALTGTAPLIKQATLRVDNGLVANRFGLDSDEMGQPAEAGRRSVTLDLMMEHENSTHFGHHIADTEVECTLTLSDGTQSFEVMVHGDAIAATPRVASRTGLTEQPYQITAGSDSGGSSADSDAFRITYTAPAASL